MFYPVVFPIAADLDPAAALEVETAVVCTLIGGDREWQRTLEPAKLAASLLDELQFMGVTPAHEHEAEVRRFLEANALHMAEFLRHVPHARAQSDCIWAVPEPKAFTALPVDVRERWWPLIVEQLRMPIQPQPLAPSGDVQHALAGR